MSPYRSARPCTYPGCTELVTSGSRCGAHVEVYHKQGYRAWYQSPEWRRIRADQLQAQPWCEDCKARGEMTLATDVDHVIPHRGDVKVFMSGPFRSLCHSCHSKKTIREVMA